MPNVVFPPLTLAEWQPTRNTIHGYARVLGEIRHAFAPRQKHSFHGSLYVTAAGLSTAPIPWGPLTFELQLDYAAGQARLTTNRGSHRQIALQGQSVAEFLDQTLAALLEADIQLALKPAWFPDRSTGVYDAAAVARFWLALSQVDSIFRRFRGELRSETGPVQLWPHGFDLAMLWFSGRLIPGQESAKPRDADEQMNFGFSTGDAGIPEPYFYVTAYPLPPALPKVQLPGEAAWHAGGWQGAVLKYRSLLNVSDPETALLNFLRSVQREGARLMSARFDQG